MQRLPSENVWSCGQDFCRGEAIEASDIDLVVLLDTVELADLDVYRSIIHALPEKHKACGFISGTGKFFHLAPA